MGKDEKQVAGLLRYREKKLVKEMDDLGDVEDYKSKIKKVCFICGRECNPSKDFGYYLRNGNLCNPKCYASSTDKKHY